MSDETTDRSAGAPDRRRPASGGDGVGSPFQTRAAFLKNRSWELVVGLNRGACARGGAQHGANTESFKATRAEWENERTRESTLLEALDFLKSCHRKAPFLFFNGNTFADIARNTADVIFAEIPTGRRRALISSIAHYVAGVLDRCTRRCIGWATFPRTRVRRSIRRWCLARPAVRCRRSFT